jgi:hypothetical protein
MFNQLEAMYNIYYKEYGITGTKNEADEIRLFFMEIKDSSYLDRKYICTMSGEIKQGDIITALNEHWIVIQEDKEINRTYSRFIATRIHNQINFGIDGFLYTTLGVISTGSQGTNSNQYMTTADGKMIVTVQKNTMTSKIKTSDRVIKFGSAWLVVAVTNEILGLLNITLEKTILLTGESLVDEIPNTVSKWTISLEEMPSLKLGTSTEINCTVTRDEVVTSTGFSIIWTSNNNDVATVLDGVVTALNVGSVIITATIQNTVVKASIALEIDNEDMIEYRVTPENRIVKKGAPVTCEVNKYVNGVLVPETFVFTGSGVTASYFTLTTLTGNSFKITNTYGYVAPPLVIKAVANSDGAIQEASFLLRTLV